MHSLSEGRLWNLCPEPVLIDTRKAPHQYQPRHRHQFSHLCFSCGKWQCQLPSERTVSRDSQIQSSHSTRAGWHPRVTQGWVKVPPVCFGGPGSTGLGGLRWLHGPSAASWMLPESLWEPTSKQRHTLCRTWWLSTLRPLSLDVFALQPPWAVLGSISGACWRPRSSPCWSEQIGKWYKEQSPSPSMVFMVNKNKVRGGSMAGVGGCPRTGDPTSSMDSCPKKEWQMTPSGLLNLPGKQVSPLPHGWSEPRGKGVSNTHTNVQLSKYHLMLTDPVSPLCGHAPITDTMFMWPISNPKIHNSFFF